MPSAAFLDRLNKAFNGFPPILKDAVLTFAREFDSDDEAGEQASEVFERFSAHHALRAMGLDDFDTAKALVGGENDTQIDAVALTINGELIDSADAIEQRAAAAEEGAAFDVGLIFVQATMSYKFPSEKVALYMMGIQNFFLDQPVIPNNAAVAAAIELKNAAFAALRRLEATSKVLCEVFIVWPGTWTTDGHIGHATSIAEAGLKSLERAHVTLSTRFHRWDGVELAKLAQADHLANDGEITVAGLLPLPTIPGVDFGAIGYVRARDLLRAVCEGDLADTGARLRETVFYGNVRAFLGFGNEAQVNTRIAETLTADDGLRRAEFVLRNNGVTILARHAVPQPIDATATGTRLTLTDFHVVNGSQTTHTLFTHRDKLDDTVLVPLKVVATTDAGIARDVVLGLNRQTPIDEIQILARNEFVGRVKRHLDLVRQGQAFWLNGRQTPLIMFERRTGEYRTVAAPDAQLRVVSLEEMMQAYGSIFLEIPHRVHREGRTVLLKAVPEHIFNDAHDVAFYHLSALLLWRARQHFRSMVAWNQYPARHQLLFALRQVSEPYICPQGRRDGESHEYLRDMRQQLLRNDGWSQHVKTAMDVVVEAARQVDKARREKAKAPARALPDVTADLAGLTDMTKAVRIQSVAARKA